MFSHLSVTRIINRLIFHTTQLLQINRVRVHLKAEIMQMLDRRKVLKQRKGTSVLGH